MQGNLDLLVTCSVIVAFLVQAQLSVLLMTIVEFILKLCRSITSKVYYLSKLTEDFLEQKNRLAGLLFGCCILLVHATQCFEGRYISAAKCAIVCTGAASLRIPLFCNINKLELTTSIIR